MDLGGKTILILGGSGLVGAAVARRLLRFSPRKIVLVGLEKGELESEVKALRSLAGSTDVEIAWGNVFLPSSVARRPRAEILADPEARRLVLGDLFDEISPGILERSLLFDLFDRLRPDAVVDCINTATAFAYQDVFRSAQGLLAALRRGAVPPELIEEHLLSIPIPQLIRHMQIVLEAVKRAETQVYVKVGTSGTGGMGFNIPYTHSEERPSRMLLTKSALAGGHTLLLFLMARTPDAPATVEIKPTAAIAWRDIRFGPVRRWGEAMRLVDCPEPLALEAALRDDAGGWKDLGRPLESVYADVGENGLFARDEFETVTALGQMEFITPEEIADTIVLEMTGRATGHNVVAALDSATSGPTYRAGALRGEALRRLGDLEERHGVRAVAFEMLGPPRLSKRLYESHVLSRIRPSVRALAESDAAGLSRDAARHVVEDGGLRSTVISVGLPIIVGEGRVFRGSVILVRPGNGDVEQAIATGWVDLRPPNCALWIERAKCMIAEAGSRERGSGSGVDWDAIEPDDPIRPPAFATWIFRREDRGERIKR